MGNPLDFILTPGQAHDLEGADALLPDMAAETLLADKAFDADERVIEPLLARGKTFVIPPKSNRKVQRDFDKDAYKARHLIENFFCKLKQYRAIATRYDKTARNFLPPSIWPPQSFGHLRQAPARMFAAMRLFDAARNAWGDNPILHLSRRDWGSAADDRCLGDGGARQTFEDGYSLALSRRGAAKKA